MAKSDHEKLGKEVEKILVRDYFGKHAGWGRFIWLNFVRGVAIGVGSVIGATIFIGILVWLLSLAGNLPGIGEFFNSTKDTIQQKVR